jgi:LPXTG-motif cell wall-anchored protein
MQSNAHRVSTHTLAGIAVGSVLLVGLFASPGSVDAQATDPVAVFTAFNIAVNAHDVDAALAFFADDAVVQFPNQPPPNIHRGRSEIRAWLQGDAAQHIQVRTENVQAAGDRVLCIGKADVDALRPLGITLVGTVEAVVQSGKISSFTFTLSADTLAELQALAAQPQELPQTGGAGLSLDLLLVVAALGICSLGMALRRKNH